jgi:methionine aminopeptidase
VGRTAPTSSVNANSSDSHYEPTAERSAPIREGDFLLIDIWARVNKPASIYYDITWTGVVGREPTEREQHCLCDGGEGARRGDWRGRAGLRRGPCRFAASRPTTRRAR